MKLLIFEGDYLNLGANPIDNGAMFTFFGEKEDDCKVCLIHHKTKERITVDVPAQYCRGSLRSVKVCGFEPKDYSYLYMIQGEDVLDPYATVICGRNQWMDFSRMKEDYALSAGFSMGSFDWEEDVFPEIPRNKMIMYKLHMRGFTMDKGASPSKRGTFMGLMDKLDYLKNLGVTTIEVMPVYEFEEMMIPPKLKLPDYVKWEGVEEQIRQEASDKPNFWGYGPGNYFAVKASYASKPENAINEFKNLVKQIHSKGMELIMEMYFPEHTNPHLVLNVLRYWVCEYHVDGFHLLGDNLPIQGIVYDPVLSRTKLFYVDFDEYIINDRKHENLFIYRDEYQYPAKKVLNHMNADMNELLNQQKKQGMHHSFVNYLTGNNGFTLYDLFSYNDRHNEENGEGNQDGNPWNFSNNQGVEGPSKKKSILNARNRQWKNAFVMLLTAMSVPLIWSGDEFKNSQRGNNNPYCQDNEIGWVNWKNNQSVRADIEFVSNLIAFRATHPILSLAKPYTFSDYRNIGVPDFSLHGEYAWAYDSNPGNMAIGMMYSGDYSGDEQHNESVYIGYNFYSSDANLALPTLPEKKRWYLVCDTSEETFKFDTNGGLLNNQNNVKLSPISVVILIGK